MAAAVFDTEQKWGVLKDGLDLVISISFNIATNQTITKAHWANLYKCVLFVFLNPPTCGKIRLTLANHLMQHGVHMVHDQRRQEEGGALHEAQGLP
jgi:hypothetical protein